MQRFDYWFGNLAICCVVIAGYLTVCDLFHTPSVFENARLEAALSAPLLVWLICRRTFHWADPRS
jgi:hypothetical protein